MVTYDPPSVLELDWGGVQLRFELRADGAGTMLTFVDTFDQLGKAADDAAGWHTCLDQLAYELEGGTAPWTVPERWKQVHRSYVDRFGPEASTIGPG